MRIESNLEWRWGLAFGAYFFGRSDLYGFDDCLFSVVLFCGPIFMEFDVVKEII